MSDEVDFFGIQEGKVSTTPGGGESMSYGETPNGKNAVTKYFIDTYPPRG